MPGPIVPAGHDTPFGALLTRCCPGGVVALGRRWPGLSLAGRVLLLLGLFVALDYFMREVCRLPASVYEQRSLVRGLVGRIGVFGVSSLALAALALSRYGALLSSWSALAAGVQIRRFVVLLAAAMAWSMSTLEYNYYFDQGYHADRVVLAALLVLLYIRPLFIYPFLAVAFVLLWQIAEPSLGGGPVFPHKLQVLNVLTMFAAAFLLHAATGRWRVDDFVFFTCCLVAAAYWEPAVTKIQLNWLTHGHLYRMLPAAYAHGWLSFLDPATITAYATMVSRLDWPMRIFVLAVETGCLFFLWRRAWSCLLLVSVMVFHCAVFALYGFLFWTWILLDGALLVLLLWDRTAARYDIHTPAHLLLSVVLIGSASAWCSPSKLGWYDTRVTYTYRYEAAGASGTRYTVAPRFFGPYADIFTLGNFSFLVRQHGYLVGPYGITGHRERAARLHEAKSAQALFAVERELGTDRYDAVRAAAFFAFLTRYLAHRNGDAGHPVIARLPRPPPQFWSHGRGRVYGGQEPLREVTVHEVTTLFDDRHVREVRTLELARLPIPGVDGAPH